MDNVQFVAWARKEADKLANVGTHTVSTAPAVEFLRIHAPGEFYSHAQVAGIDALNMARSGRQDGRGRNEVARILLAWADFVDAGMANTIPYGMQSRLDAAIDLMEQVQVFLEDHGVVPAAPVMLAGAALEEALRGLMERCDSVIDGRPGIAKYSAALRKCDLISRQDAKNIESWAGLRNSAAHGHFENVSREEARVMAAGINLFLQQLSAS